MARFDKLELGVPQSPAWAPETGGEQDEGHWMLQADRDRRAGHYENALRHYSRALEYDKSLSGGWVGQVQMLVLLDEWPEAETWARKALELFPGQADLLAGRAQALCRTGDQKQAHALCDAAMSGCGQSAYRWMVRGELMLANRQDTDHHCFDKALGLERDWLVPLEIALICLHYRSPAKALPRARRAVEFAPDAPYAWYIQGRCLQELGLQRQARQAYAQCLELCPGHLDAERRRTQCEKETGWFRRLRHLFSASR
jgi:tetratricopeptide (TPR) repeat protein